MSYTVLSNDGDVIGRNLTLARAADEILSSDSREWEIRQQDDGGYRLWSRQQVANVRWGKTVVMSYAETVEEAKAEIFTAVVNSDWPGHYTAITDHAYDAMLAELAEQEACDE
jgi:hypothetical protein